jgi:hypothetical protein
VEGTLEGNDLVGAVLELRTPLAREFYRAFIGFRATVCEENAVETGVIYEELRKLGARNVPKSGTRMNESTRLDHDWGRVPETIYCPTLNAIQVPLPVLVENPRTFTSNESQLGSSRDLHQCFDRNLKRFHDRVTSYTGNFPGRTAQSDHIPTPLP